MATDIVNALFGVTPDSYQQAQQDRADAQALQFAKLDPFQQANYAIGRGANMLAGAVGGALGGQDPELQRITMRQQIAGQINPNDPASIERGIVALQQGGDTQGAFMLADIGRKLDSEMAQAEQRRAAGKASLAQAAREKVAGIPTDIRVGREIAGLQEQISQLTNLPASPERDQALRLASGQLSELQRLTAKAVTLDPRFGVDRESLSMAAYGKSFAQLTQTEQGLVNDKVQENKNKTAAEGASKILMPGQNALVDIPNFRNTVQRTIDSQLKTINSVDQALENINNSINSGRFTDYRAAQVQFARAISGAGDLNQRELKAAGADPSLLGGTADYLSTLFSSTPTLDTQKKIRATLEAIRNVAAKKGNDEVNAQRKIALGTPGYDEAAVNRALSFPELATPVTKTKLLSSSDQTLLDKYAPKAK
jgi:hypothetical protein